MGKIILISCVSKKLDKIATASELYLSPLFKLSYQYAQYLRPDGIFILSAKYGLLSPTAQVEPYNLTLNEMSLKEVRRWSEKVMEQLRTITNPENDHYVFLAGERYRKHLIPHLKNYEVPMQGLTIGRQLQYLKKQVTNESV